MRARYLQHTATHCTTLYHTATHCLLGMLTSFSRKKYVGSRSAPHCAPHCNTPQHTVFWECLPAVPKKKYAGSRFSTHCNTLCNTLHHTSQHGDTLSFGNADQSFPRRNLRAQYLNTCNTLQHTLLQTLQHTLRHNLQRTAKHCKTLQHTATHCDTLQHTATHCTTYCQILSTTSRNLRALYLNICNTLQQPLQHTLQQPL